MTLPSRDLGQNKRYTGEKGAIVMLVELSIRYIHLLGIVVLGSLLTAEHLLAKGNLDKDQLKRIRIIDLAYGISAVVVMIAGILLWSSYGMPASFYTPNPLFHTKIALFFAMAAFSIHPTIFFLKHRDAQFVEIPKTVVNCIRAELICLVLIPLLAVLMAAGVGLN